LSSFVFLINWGCIVSHKSVETLVLGLLQHFALSSICVSSCLSLFGFDSLVFVANFLFFYVPPSELQKYFSFYPFMFWRCLYFRASQFSKQHVMQKRRSRFKNKRCILWLPLLKFELHMLGSSS
jgi:hypothetical protein